MKSDKRSTKPHPLPDAEVASCMKQVKAWRREGRFLVREIGFPSFMEGIQFVNRVATAAEEMDHHPDILISWRRVTLRLTSHDAGGITTRDFALAARIDALESAKGGQGAP